MENINLFVVFIEGLLSIFSPCILPILPIYLSMLSNSSVENIQDSSFNNKLLIKNTIFFTIGICITFFILGSSMNALGSFLNVNRYSIMLIGGAIIILMGLFYVGVIKSNLLSREKRFNLEAKKMTPISAFLLGFTFSFGWTPCIGPILASVIIMASSSESSMTSTLLILVYSLGFILPFLIASIFYSKLYKRLNKIKKHMNLIKQISGIIIIIAGFIMIVNGFIGINKTSNIKDANSSQSNISSQEEEEDEKLDIIDFTLYDQYGEAHTLSEYKGKVVFLNFWATWCGPCRSEMPHIEEIYKQYNENNDDVVILGVASPNLGREGSEENIKNFLREGNYTFPVVMDTNGEFAFQYGVSAYPTTFIIDKEGYVKGYIPGAMNKETMEKIIESER